MPVWAAPSALACVCSPCPSHVLISHELTPWGEVPRITACPASLCSNGLWNHILHLGCRSGWDPAPCSVRLLVALYWKLPPAPSLFQTVGASGHVRWPRLGLGFFSLTLAMSCTACKATPGWAYWQKLLGSWRGSREHLLVGCVSEPTQGPTSRRKHHNQWRPQLCWERTLAGPGGLGSYGVSSAYRFQRYPFLAECGQLLSNG